MVPVATGDLHFRQCCTATEPLHGWETLTTRPPKGSTPTKAPEGRLDARPEEAADRAATAAAAPRPRALRGPATARRPRKMMRCLENKTSWQEGLWNRRR